MKISTLYLFLLPLIALTADYASHPPMRQLPQPVDRERVTDQAREITPADNLQESLDALQPGDTLYLRGGVYYGTFTVRAQGTPAKPITISAWPGELAIIDGGFREFHDNPADSWEPVPDGAPHEYQSTRTYPDVQARVNGLNVMGNFADSMVPLHSYRFRADFLSDNPYWNLPKNSDAEAGIYCGPGLWYNMETKRIHVRLDHTRLNMLGEDNYRGETDPRRLPLVVAGHTDGTPLALRNSACLKVQDLVLRGSARTPIYLQDCQAIVLEHITAYAGTTCIQIRQTHGLRVYNSAFRGLAAPWTSRAHLKYRSVEADLFSAGSWYPVFNSDFELAWSEFTDSVDGIFIGNVNGFKMHHCLLDNLTDDGLFLTAQTIYDGTTPGGPLEIYQNVLSQCLTTFAFGVGHGRQRTIAEGKQTGAGAWITRNFIDLREPVFKSPPRSAEDDTTPWPIGSRSVGDHGSPAWEPMNVYHNTIVARDASFRNYYLNGWGGHVSNTGPRRAWNNIYVQLNGLPGRTLPPGWVDMEIDYNLHWSPGADAEAATTFANQLRRSVERASQAPKPPPKREVKPPQPPTGLGQQKTKEDAPLELEEKTPPKPITVERDWGANDMFADPLFATPGYALSPESPAIDAGRAIPDSWPDPLRDQDPDKPDLGMLPAGVTPWRIGMFGRFDAFGEPAPPPLQHHQAEMPPLPAMPPKPTQPAILVNGYPPFNAPVLHFCLERKRVEVEQIDRTWLPPSEYARYSMVAITGNLERAQMEPRRYTEADLEHVRSYIQNGGFLLLTTMTESVFERHVLEDLLGQTEPQDATIRCNLKIGQGRIICIDERTANALPHGRTPTSLEEEELWESRMRALLDLFDQLYPIP